MNTPGETIETVVARRLTSKSVIVVCVIVLIQVYRISAYSTAQAAITGSAAAPWFFPAFADVFFGITAPLVAFILWRKTGLGVWVVGIVWLALSFFDFVDGLTTAITVGPPGNASVSSAYIIVWFLAWLLVDVIAFTLLTRKSAQLHLLQPQ